MPEISLPEVKLPKFELPEGLRDMTRDDIQKALPDIKLPKIDLPRQAERFASDVGRNIDNALPRRSGPSPVPFAVLAMIGGVVVGWILATSPATQRRITGFMDWVGGRIDDWRNRGTLDDLDDELDAGAERFTGTNLSDLGISGGAYAGAGTSTMHAATEGDAWSGGTTAADTSDGYGLRTGGGVGAEGGTDGDEQRDETLSGDFRGQSLGAASADDFRRTDDPELVDDLTPGVEPVATEAVVVEEVIVVDETGTADASGGAHRPTDTMQIDDTEGDDAPGVGRRGAVGDERLAGGSGRLTDTMQIDDTEGDDAPGTGRV